MTTPSPQPIKGYRQVSPEHIRILNLMKAQEERVLRFMDAIKEQGPAVGLEMDPRLAAVARTQLELGFLAFGKAIMRPNRLTDEELFAIDATVVTEAPAEPEVLE